MLLLLTYVVTRSYYVITWSYYVASLYMLYILPYANQFVFLPRFVCLLLSTSKLNCIVTIRALGVCISESNNVTVLFYASADIVQPESLCFLAVCACIRPCILNIVSAVSWKKYLTYFHQTFSIGAFWDKDSFGVKRSKVQGHGQSTCCKMHFLALLTQCLENYWTKCPKLVGLMHFLDEDECFSFAGQKVEDRAWPTAQHVEAYRAWCCLSSSIFSYYCPTLYICSRLSLCLKPCRSLACSKLFNVL